MQWDLCVFGKGRGEKRARDGERSASTEDASLQASLRRKRAFFERKLSMLAKVDDRYYCFPAPLAWEDDPCACGCNTSRERCLINQRQVCDIHLQVHCRPKKTLSVMHDQVRSKYVRHLNQVMPSET